MSKDLSCFEQEKKKAKASPSIRNQDKKHGKDIISLALDIDKKSKDSECSKKIMAELKELHCPEVQPSLTCSELRKLGQHVELY